MVDEINTDTPNSNYDVMDTILLLNQWQLHHNSDDLQTEKSLTQENKISYFIYKKKKNSTLFSYLREYKCD